MNRFPILVLLPVLLMGGTINAWAAPVIPADVLKAEQDERWQDALDGLQKALKAEPKRLDLWLEMADIYEHLSRQPEMVHAMEQAAAIAPNDATIQFRLAKTYSYVDQPGKAIAPCSRALAIDPNNADYLTGCAQLASWAGDLKASEDWYSRILAAHPDDDAVLLNLARTRSWAGKLDQSGKDYRRYLAKHPKEKEVWIEYARVESWRGNYPVALDTLEHYRREFGDSEEYRREKARVLAWAERPALSMQINDPLLRQHPDDYELNYTNTVALNNARRPTDALNSLKILQRLRPESKDTYDVSRVVRTPLRSNVSLGLNYYNDSDDITVTRTSLYGEYVLNPQTRLLAGLGDHHLKAKIGSGYETAGGQDSIRHSELWVGVRHRFNPLAELEAVAGAGEIQHGGSYNPYRVTLDLQPRDNLKFALERQHELYSVSPRSVSLGIKRDANRVRVEWQPDLRWVVDAAATGESFSDGNKRWSAELAPRRAIVRTEKWNVDLGVSGEWFGFDRDPGNGYWAPASYKRYAATGFFYYKIDDDDGISVVTSLGWHKDNTQSSFAFGHDVAVEGIFGLYKDWQLRVTLGHADRGQPTGAYRGYSAEAVLTRRF